MIFNRSMHPSVINDVMTGVLAEETMGVFVVNVWAGVVINTSSDVQIAVTIDGVVDINFEEVLTGVKENILVVTMTVLYFTIPTT